eukprot:TRINITY_DN5607_c0_g2_i1.p1 TRINITY_DN5607_c0_g2~~TRINITY_DN5607_c0_g2_i1.p1  ORF type:complete len:534 (+),score=137.86 TRINITY_DN5607_c0_g2_i1:23-1603(+)
MAAPAPESEALAHTGAKGAAAGSEPERQGFKRKLDEAHPAPVVCPYLDTIDRAALDFDFEKLCSVSLKNLNVYGCLVCGKYFHGRAKGTPAYNHSLNSGHHVFINLGNGRAYCLPDLYEVKDASLADIKYNLNPTYTADQIKNLHLLAKKKCRGLDGQEFIAGFVGLNNLKNTDFLNVVVQSVARIPELQQFYMSPFPYTKVPELARSFGELLRKIWNPKAFKGHVSPHELMQELTTRSNKKFQIGVKSDPIELLQFLLNELHIDDVRNRKFKRGEESVVHSTFQGRVLVKRQRVRIAEVGGVKRETKEGEEEVKETPFLFLRLNLPVTPLFKEESEKNIIPQVPLFALLHKYDGIEETVEAVRGETERADKFQYNITRLPKYLILHYRRFSKNYWFKEKNKTIVNFPVKSLDMRDFCTPEEAARHKNCKYDLIANVCHSGDVADGEFYVHVFNRATGEWHQIQDLTVTGAVPQEISCSAPYIQVWERQEVAETHQQSGFEQQPDGVAALPAEAVLERQGDGPDEP